jgi:hypothetical protein
MGAAMTLPKIKPSDLESEAERLIRNGEMHSPDDLLAAIAETREKYRDKILAARKESIDDAE